jgi:hypothetical protein
VPIPNLNRLYFKVCAPVDTTQLGLNVKKDAEGWQELYDSIRATGEGLHWALTVLACTACCTNKFLLLHIDGGFACHAPTQNQHLQLS